MDNNVKIVPAICTQCGGKVEVNRDDETAKCPFCGASFIVEKAINVYNVQHANIEHADNGCLYTEVTNDEVMRWEYQEFDSAGTVLSYEDDLGDGYSSCVLSDPDIDEGVRFVVTAAFNKDDIGNEPAYYSVVRITIENYEITEASEPVIVDSLSEYDFDQ